jgi:hypothetical protein
MMLSLLPQLFMGSNKSAQIIRKEARLVGYDYNSKVGSTILDLR